MPDCLDLFCPPIRAWFSTELGEPTAVQSQAWPRIAAGEHLLISSPTGSGKTLTAFLWSLDRLLSGAWPGGRLTVLYISPLKALGNDIQRNLLLPLSRIPGFAGGAQLPEPRVEIRSGDTPPDARRRMLRNPPEILITTPESLNILLSSAGGRSLFGQLQTVILDEIHAVVGSKRGLHLMTAVERLARLNGEFQRIALSATVRPAERVARWVGGWQQTHAGADPGFTPRPVGVVAPPAAKKIVVQVRLPAAKPDPGPADSDAFWAKLVGELKQTVRRNRSTLIFCNSRRMVEKITRLVNAGEAETMAYSHHGSLSREIRSVVEQRLKDGQLKAIVATNSLELGIDVGSVDQVALVQVPPTVASAVQRIGRSGHGVGETSRGVLYAVHRRGLLDAAAVAEAVAEGEIEEVEPITDALDILAQVILSMTVLADRPVDELFHAVRCADAYHHLQRHHFDLVVDMLAGRYASARVRQLNPLISVDRIAGTVRARPGAQRLLFQSGGTIADRGYYKLRVEGSGALVGELDEEFVWERSVGDTFTLGVQSWRVQSISHNDVFVSAVAGASAMAPFWRADERDRSHFLAARCGDLLEWAVERLRSPRLPKDLATRCHLHPEAAAGLIDLLREQVQATGTLPHRHQVVEEHVASSRGRAGERQVILHTIWGGRVNRPLALALAAAWRRRHGTPPVVAHDDDCILLSVPSELEPLDPLALVQPHELEALVHEQLAGSGFFGARFREAAGCALLLPRAGFSRRTPLWLHRQRAKELLNEVAPEQDFPIVVEAWRACLRDHFELTRLKELLIAVREGRIAVQRVHTEAPSPFAAQVMWKQTNQLMYEDDTPEDRRGATLKRQLLTEVATSPSLRPAIPEEVAAELDERLKRIAPGYAPRDARDLLDWVGERALVPDVQWSELLTAMVRDHEVDPVELVSELADRLVLVDTLSPPTSRFVCQLQALPRLLLATGRSNEDVHVTRLDGSASPHPNELPTALTEEASQWQLDDLLAEWLRWTGPVAVSALPSLLGLDTGAVQAGLTALVEEGTVVVDRLTADSAEEQICDRENLERLLRMLRARSRPTAEAVPLDILPLHLARHQGLARRHASPTDLQEVLESLFGLAAPVALWEREVIPARVEPYHSAWLDQLLATSDLRWVGCGERRIAFVLDGDRELLGASDQYASEPSVFPHAWGRYPLDQLASSSGLDTGELAQRLWSEAWQGRATTDSFAPLRQGVANNFAPPTQPAPSLGPRSRRRLRLHRWSTGRPFEGNWSPLPELAPVSDPLDAAELERDRARLLLDRYGIVFRELTLRELPELRWASVFRALRLMELSGEILAGRFFTGIQGLQFASHEAARRLFAGLDEDQVWWCNAADPASPCGLSLAALDARLPKRVSSSHLAFHGRRLVVVSEAGGSRLSIDLAPDHPVLGEALGFLANMLGRQVDPVNHVDVTEINGEAAATSAYRPILATLFHTSTTRTALRLGRRY